ncbi:MAG: hypothetical protein QME45_03865 [Clostridiales bacterium]|nr:hypothetical protein [Clostridiales bacterium]HBM80196.1 hypothetical protein [Clostridiaceae bacterium]
MENNNSKNTSRHGGMLKHGLMMMACCLLPLVVIFALPLLNIKGGTVLPLLASLACPIGMVLMMFGMGHLGKGGSCHGDGKSRLPQEK